MKQDAEKQGLNKVVIAGLSIVIVILAVALIMSLHSSKSGYQTPLSTTINPQATTVALTTTTQSLSPSTTTTIDENNTVVQILYSNKTVHIAAPQHNYEYSYVN